MSTKKLSNVSLDDYREFLTKVGCKKTGTEGGREKWVRKDLTRPIIVQTHVRPVTTLFLHSSVTSFVGCLFNWYTYK